MSHMKYLLDSDAATCLCKYELVEDLSAALNISIADCFVLPQLRYQLRLNNLKKATTKLGTLAAVAQAQLLVSSASEIIVLADSANYVLLEGTPDIDGGELALFAALCASSDSKLLTGDKRSLVALCKVEGQVASSSYWARILCTEEAIALIIEKFGWEHVSKKVRSRPDANMGLSIIFGRTTANSAEVVADGLKSYLNELVANTKGKYASPFLAASVLQ